MIFDTPIDLSRLGNLLDIRCILRIVLINILIYIIIQYINVYNIMCIYIYMYYVT